MSKGKNKINDNKAVFDKEKAIETAYGSEDLLRDLAEMFINKYPEYISGIREAIDSRNNETVRKSAHKLKGAVANFGKEIAVYKTVLRLERIGKESRMDEAEEIYRGLVKDVGCLVDALRVVAKLKY